MKSNFLSSNLNLSLLALDNGDVDCVVAGAVNTTSRVIRSSIRIIGLHSSAKWISSVFFMLSPCGKKLYTFSDCGVIPDPNPEQLCEIAFQASKLHDLVFKESPKVSFLSFSTKRSVS